MAVCTPTPSTLFQTVTSTTVITTSTVAVQEPDGSPITLPLTVTSIITVTDPTATLSASCLSTPISTIPSAQSTPTQYSFAPTTIVITTTIIITATTLPNVVTEIRSSTLSDGVVSMFMITTASTPTVALASNSVTALQTSKSSRNTAPIAGGAVGGFVFLVVVVATTWYILKKCHKPKAAVGEEGNELPYPVTQDQYQNRQSDLIEESRLYEHGLMGRKTQTDPGSSPSTIHDGRPDLVTAPISTSTIGLTPLESVSGNIVAIHGALGEVGRRASHNSTMPRGAVPPNRLRYSGGSISGASSSVAQPSNWRPLRAINSPGSPLSMSSLSNSSSGAAPSSSSLSVTDNESAWSEKCPARGPSSLAGAILSNVGQFQSGSGPGEVFEETTSSAEHGPAGPITGESPDAPSASGNRHQTI